MHRFKPYLEQAYLGSYINEGNRNSSFFMSTKFYHELVNVCDTPNSLSLCIDPISMFNLIRWDTASNIENI